LLLEGRLGHTTAGELEAVTKRLVDQGVSTLVLDLAGVDYISSGALDVLGWLETHLGSRRGRLILRNPSVSARLALDLAGMLPPEPDNQ
jgi:anti-anti-sigma factor